AGPEFEFLAESNRQMPIGKNKNTKIGPVYPVERREKLYKVEKRVSTKSFPRFNILTQEFST
nr:hypothetical protein [Chlamydiota bacterium]